MPKSDGRDDGRYDHCYERGLAATLRRYARERRDGTLLVDEPAFVVEYLRDGEWWLWGRYSYAAMAEAVAARVFAQDGAATRFGPARMERRQ